MNMFQPATWAMAFPDLFPWADGAPFVKRETSVEAGEVFRYLLLREELVYGEHEEQPALLDGAIPQHGSIEFARRGLELRCWWTLFCESQQWVVALPSVFLER